MAYTVTNRDELKKVDLKKIHKRNSLLNSAFRLFTENGFSETSISDIVKGAGVAKGTFYLYFTDKFDLRNKVIAHHAGHVFHQAYQARCQQEDLSPEDALIFITDHILNQFESNQKMMYFISKHLSWAVFRNSILEESSLFGEDEAAASFRTLLAETDRYFNESEIMLYMILEFTSGASYNPILYQQPASLEEIKPHIYGVIRQIMARYRKSPEEIV